MPSWLLKTGLQHVVSHLPKPYFWSGLLQKYATRSSELSDTGFSSYVDYSQRHIDTLFGLSPHCRPDFTALEIGTGRYPIVPVGMYLSGVSEVWTYDIDSWMSAEHVRETLRRYLRLAHTEQLHTLLPRLREDRVAALEEVLARGMREDPSALLAPLGIHAFVADAREGRVPEDTIDLAFSYSVLQYIPAQAISELFVLFRRIARAGGIQSHFIVLEDQFSYFDHRISQLNFLRYSDRWWRRLDSPLIPQTRLRISDYRTLLQESGWRIVREESESADAAELDRFTLAREFEHYNQEDLLVVRSWIAARAESTKSDGTPG